MAADKDTLHTMDNDAKLETFHELIRTLLSCYGEAGHESFSKINMYRDQIGISLTTLSKPKTPFRITTFPRAQRTSFPLVTIK